MKRMSRAFALVLVALGLTVALGVPAQASTAASRAKTDSQKAPILHNPHGDCSVGAARGTGPIIGSAKFTETATTVSSTVSVKHLKPNWVYGFSLVQTPSGEGCVFPGVTESTFTTDSKGRGHLKWSEARIPSQTGAFVTIFTNAGGADSASSLGVTF